MDVPALFCLGCEFGIFFQSDVEFQVLDQSRRSRFEGE